MIIGRGRGRRREHPQPVAHAHTKRTPIAMALLLRKKRWKKPGMRRTYFQSGTLSDMVSSGHVTLSLRSKGPSRADMAQLPVAHA